MGTLAGDEHSTLGSGSVLIDTDYADVGAPHLSSRLLGFRFRYKPSLCFDRQKQQISQILRFGSGMRKLLYFP